LFKLVAALTERVAALEAHRHGYTSRIGNVSRLAARLRPPAPHDMAEQLAEAEAEQEVWDELPYKPPNPSTPPPTPGAAVDTPAAGSPPGPAVGNPPRKRSSICYDAAWLISMTCPNHPVITELRDLAAHHAATEDR
jgi:hypothetical protein